VGMFSAAESDGVAMIAGRAGASAVVAKGASAQQVCAAAVAAWSQPSLPAPPLIGAGSLLGEGLNPASCWLAVRGWSGAGRVTCGACPPVVPGPDQGFRCGADPARTRRPRSRAGSGPLCARPPAVPRFSVTRDGAVCRFQLAVSAWEGRRGGLRVGLGDL
jgi:hypothetical protein